MEIILAEPRGYCAGVERAITIVERAIDIYAEHDIYVKHEIVHNKYVVDNLKNRGVTFIEDLNDVPDGSVLIFSAHGVSQKIEDEARARDLIIIDACCPLVTKVHLEAMKYDQQDKEIILIGHAGHPEVEGTAGRVKSKVILVSSAADVDKVEVKDPNKLAYVTQTTLSVDDTKDIIQKLKTRFPNISGPHAKDLCYATQNRQDAVKDLAKLVDVILVIGASNSSNSNRLKDVAEKAGLAAYLINDVTDIKEHWFTNDIRNIGITAGASAPEILVQQVVDFLKSKYNATVKNMETMIKEDIKFRLPKEVRDAS